MNVSLIRTLFVALFFSAITVAPAVAQDNSEAYAQQIENRATNVINETMAAVAERVEDFNRRMAAIYALTPLESVNLDSAKIVSNMKEIEQFLSFVDTYRGQAKALTQVLNDSIVSLRKELPVSQRKTFLISFEKAYNKDATAFDGYLASLSKLFRRVNSALEYLRNAPFEITGSTIEFSQEKDHNRYKEFIEGVQAATADVNKAAESSKKATTEANKVMQDVYGKE